MNRLLTIGIVALLFGLASGCGAVAPGGFESDSEPVAQGDGDLFSGLDADFTAHESAILPAKYIIVRGDTLSHISQKFYGTVKHWRRILEANPGLKERELKIGQEIIIPAL